MPVSSSLDLGHIGKGRAPSVLEAENSVPRDGPTRLNNSANIRSFRMNPISIASYKGANYPYVGELVGKGHISGIENDANSPTNTQPTIQSRQINGNDLEGLVSDDDDNVLMNSLADNELNLSEPISVKDAMSRPDASKWMNAINDELQSLKKSNTWKLVELPKDRKAISCRWVFKLKMRTNGTIERYKARLVARGFSQVHGVDYEETFAPVAKFKSIRVVLAIASILKYTVHQMDVKTAFLNGDLNEDIYMNVPEGLNVRPGLVCKLQKSLYGLKQSPRAWYEKLNSYLVSIQFKRCKSDNAIYTLDKGSSRVIMVVYVDDLLIVTGDKRLMSDIKTQLKAKFEMSDMGPVNTYLGIQISQCEKSGSITLNQESYFQNVLKKFKMNDCNIIGTPLDVNGKLTKEMCAKSDIEKSEVIHLPYQSLIGSLMYGMVGTRPDIAFAVGVLSKYASNFGKAHWQAGKRVLRYLQGTKALPIRYKGQLEDLQLICYCDADYASDTDSRRSVTGYVVMLANAPVSWKSVQQKTVALSTMEAEYMAIGEAVREVKYLRQLMNELGCCQQGPTRIFSDSMSAIELAKNAKHHERSKHIDVRHHFIQECIDQGDVVLHYVNTKENVADLLTKGLSRDRTTAFLGQLGMI